MGLVIFIKGAYWSPSIGKIEVVEDVPITGLSITTEKKNVVGTQVQLDVAYTPFNTNQRGVNWTIIGIGGTVDSSGLVKIAKTAKNSTVVVTATSKYNSSIKNTITLTLTYELDVDPDAIVFEDSNAERYIKEDFPALIGDHGYISKAKAAAFTESPITAKWNGTKVPAEAKSDGTNYSEGAVLSFNEFKYFTGITSIPSNFMNPESSNGVYKGGLWIKEITIPSSVTTIGSQAFRYGIQEKITIEGNITSFGIRWIQYYSGSVRPNSPVLDILYKGTNVPTWGSEGMYIGSEKQARNWYVNDAVYNDWMATTDITDAQKERLHKFSEYTEEP